MDELNTGAWPSIPTLEGKLICPVVSCGHDNVHMAEPVVGKNGVMLSCYCEAGHKWMYWISEHKGHTTVTIHDVDKVRL